MGGSNKMNGNVPGIIVAVAGVVTALTPIISVVIDTLKEKEILTNKELLVIPSLYDREFPLDLKTVSELLSNYGLKVIPSKISLRDAKAKYKNCFDFQVVDSKPKHKQKICVGETIVVRYVTQDVIDESCRLFEDIQTQKAEVKFKKAAERAGKNEQVKKRFLQQRTNQRN